MATRKLPSDALAQEGDDDAIARDANDDASEAYYVVLATMIGVPQHVRNDPALSQQIDAPFLLKGDVVPSALLGGQVPRLLKHAAIRKATSDEHPQARDAARRASSEADAQTAADSTVRTDATLKTRSSAPTSED